MNASKLILLALLALFAPAVTAEVASPFAEVASEFVHTSTGRFQLLKETGRSPVTPGPGWVRTGYAMEVGTLGWFGALGRFALVETARVCHFVNHATGAHFYTASGNECSNLIASSTGWTYDGIAFDTARPRDGCSPGYPVYRLYNNRWMFNDSMHRYTPDAGLRARLFADGWVDEGIAFCTLSWDHPPLPSNAIPSPRIGTGPQCDAAGAGACLEVNYLPPMTNSLTAFLESPYLFPNPAYPLQSHAVTGMPEPEYSLRLATAQPLADSGSILSHSFVQTNETSLGIHVSGADRQAGDYASINPQFRFGTREFPFASSRDPYLLVDFYLRVANLNRAEPGSHAYGGPVLLFVDQVSGKSFYVAILAYGSITLGDGPEAPGRDIHTGRVLVATTFRAPSFGVRHDGAWIACPGTGACEAAATWFRYLLDRAAFQVALDRARTLEPGLSANPSDYYLESYHFRNETYRDADVGLWLYGFALNVYTR